MPKRYVYTDNDIEDLKAECSGVGSVGRLFTILNRFTDRHLHYTCSCCHREEPYTESPVLKDTLWREVTGRLGMQENGPDFGLELTVLPDDESDAVRLSLDKFITSDVRETVPDDGYVMLCRGCVERALGRELFREDLAPCLMTDHVKHEYKSKNDI